MKDAVYWLVGFLVLANGATIITVMISALRVSSAFGALEEKAKSNSKRIDKLEGHVYG